MPKDELENKTISTLMEFFAEYPEEFSTRLTINKPNPKTAEGRKRIREIITIGLNKQIIPRMPKTVPDYMTALVMETFHEGEDRKDRERMQRQHQLAMNAEGVVGALLEKYIAKESLSHGWVQVAGDVIKAVDLVKKKKLGGWKLLQIKNRSTTENSSSKAIRDGTKIKIWFRSYDKKEEKNWEEFPDTKLSKVLSEKKFRKFVLDYLEDIKSQGLT